MLNFENLMQKTHSRFDSIWKYEKGQSPLVICPAGAFTQICLSDINKISSVLCLSDKNVKEKVKYGYPVKSMDEIIKEYDNFKVLILSSLHYEEIKREWMHFISEENILPCYNFDTRVHFNYFEEQYKKWLEDKKGLITFIYDNLADDISKKSFLLMLTGAEYYSACDLMSICSISQTEDPDYFHEYDFLKLTDSESYLDVGAYDGDTVESFYQAVQGKYNSIVAIEPDSELFQKLENICKRIDNQKICCMRVGLSDCVSCAELDSNHNKYMNQIVMKQDGDIRLETIDSLNRTLSLIKISVYDPKIRCSIIRGGAKTLCNDKPKLIVQIERQTDDILDIPNEILGANPEYKIYFRIMLYEQKGILRFNMAYWAV